MNFEIKAIDAARGVSMMLVDAASESEARAQAASRGFTVLRVRTAKPPLWSRRGKFPLVLFSHELVALLDAGLSLIDALQTLAEKHQQADAKAVMGRVLERLYQGLPLSRALESSPHAFPQLYVEMVRASERTGDLSRSLARFVDYQGKIDVVRSKLVTASIYPLLLFGVGGVVTLFLLGYVVPKFSAIYVDLGREQPLLSRMLMEFGRFVGENGILVLLGTVTFVGAAVFVFSRKRTREVLAGQIAKVPGIGVQMRVFQLARFYRTAGMLLRGGVPAVTALDMVAGLLDARMRAQLELATREVRQGKPISVSFEAHALTTPVAARLLRVGERTGDMGGMMDRVASFHDDEIAGWVDRFTRLFEPLLMVGIGGIIGIIVMALYMPIFDLAGSLQ
jgi:general secretion pathway protein F